MMDYACKGLEIAPYMWYNCNYNKKNLEDVKMKAINATPNEIRKIFTESYIIPDFQRPYTWEKEHCHTLWEDVVDFYNGGTDDDEKYFLGNIVVHKTGEKFAVIDGQQRLTSLLLLIKALHSRAGTYSALQSCYRISNKRDGSLTEELRVKSEVIAEDAENLRKIIFDDIESADNCPLTTNYKLFVERIDEWLRNNGSDSNAFNMLIDTFLDKVVLLPINCDSEDDALTIFQTINDRGISLSDSDIFKAKLYKFAPENKRPQFIENWNSLNNPVWLFRIYMHIIRADADDTSKETALRTFFTNRQWNRLNENNWMMIMESLIKINSVLDNWEEENYGVIDSLWAILETYPNQYWNYPIYVFLHKYGVYSETTGFTLQSDHVAKLETLLKETIKYYFIKGLVDNSVNTIKDITFKVCADIALERDYLPTFNAGITINDKEIAKSKLDNSSLSRYTRGIIILAAYLNPNQNKTKLADMLWGKYDIEHILPKSWNNYDGWTEYSHKEYIDCIGNLMLLERKINIKAQNEYLKKKKIQYANSVVQDALDMLNISDSGWTQSAVEERNVIQFERLCDFFGLE